MKTVSRPMNCATGLPGAILSTICAVADPGLSRSVTPPAMVPNSVDRHTAATVQAASGRRHRRASRPARP